MLYRLKMQTRWFSMAMLDCQRVPLTIPSLVINQPTYLGAPRLYGTILVWHYQGTRVSTHSRVRAGKPCIIAFTKTADRFMIHYIGFNFSSFSVLPRTLIKIDQLIFFRGLAQFGSTASSVWGKIYKNHHEVWGKNQCFLVSNGCSLKNPVMLQPLLIGSAAPAWCLAFFCSPWPSSTWQVGAGWDVGSHGCEFHGNFHGFWLILMDFLWILMDLIHVST